MYVFVYGTLRKGMRNHYVLKGATFVQHDCTLPEYTLLHMDAAYPGMIRGGITDIPGEVWSVSEDMLKRIDTFEGVHQGIFSRVTIPLKSGISAHAYLFNSKIGIMPV
jgi:gamma-glutamylaminecyclotransferase